LWYEFNISTDLQLTISEDYFISNNRDRSNSYNCLGVAFQLIGNHEMAELSFLQAVELFNGLILFLKLTKLYCTRYLNHPQWMSFVSYTVSVKHGCRMYLVLQPVEIVNLSNEQYALIKTKTIQSMSITRVLKLLLVRTVNFAEQSTLLQVVENGHL
jgi:hypothetical protein